MKNRIFIRRIFACAMASALLAGSSIPASAAQPATQNALAGVNITIMDKNTPATMFGFKGSTASFISVDGNTLGTMPATDMNAIVQRVSVNGLPPGNWPNLTGMEWSDWFADEFNRLRALGDGARESVLGPERFSAEWIEIEINELIRLVNQERERAGIHRLELCDDLMEFAAIRARELSQTGITHVRPNGVRVNNEVATGAKTADDAFTRWMNSPPHRRAILGEGAFGTWNRMGVAVYRGGSIIVFTR